MTNRPRRSGGGKTGRPLWLHDPGTIRAARDLRQSVEQATLAQDQAKALSLIEAWTRLEPEASEPWVYRHGLLARQGKLAEADAAGDRAIKLGFPPGSFWHDRGVIRMMRKEWAAAKTCFGEAYFLDPVNGDAANAYAAQASRELAALKP